MDLKIKSWIVNIVLLLYLIPCVIFDIRTRKISLFYLISGILLSILLPVVLDTFQGFSFILSVALTLLLFLFNKVSKDSIGLADLCLILIICAFVGIEKGVFILLSSLLLAGFSGLLIALIKKERLKEKSIPFCPFLFLSTIGAIVIWI